MPRAWSSRTAKRRTLAEMQNELAELRKIARLDSGATMDNATAKSASPTLTPDIFPSSAVGSSSTGQMAAPNTFEPGLQDLCITDKYIDDLHLGASHVDELFRIYFTRCHPYLPFVMCRSIETIYQRSPILFWVVCAVASSEMARLPFERPIRGLIADVLDPSKGNTVETVQAILILCMWPFPFANQETDSSFIYSGIATQVSLSIGLHRPAIDAGFQNGACTGVTDEDMRRTTWLACFIVAQMQASRRGVPATVLADYSLLSSFDNPGVPQELSHLCYISHLTVEAAQALGARGSNTTGLVEPSARISLINVFGQQFDDIRRLRFPKPSENVEIFFLSSRLQMWSFAIHNDVPVSANTVQIISQAREDAVRLIQVACEKNMSLMPFYYRRSVCYAALLLYRIKLGPYRWQDDMIDHHVERARQALSACKSPNLGQFLDKVMSPENRYAFTCASGDKESPHRSRMAAFLPFDFLKVCKDLQQANVLLSSEFLDLDNLPWTEFQYS
ncbi:Regulatory protein leu3 [Exophiala sideris]|nr:Regulatory protein leu3 [Exophiala sideris]